MLDLLLQFFRICLSIILGKDIAHEFIYVFIVVFWKGKQPKEMNIQAHYDDDDRDSKRRRKQK